MDAPTALVRIRARLGAKRFSVWSGDTPACVLVACLNLIAMALVLRLWDANLAVPFRYADDANLHLMLIKGIIENGWFWTNPDLAAPIGQQLHDYPVFAGDTLNVLLVKLLGTVDGNPAVVMNVFYVLTYPLTALSAFIVMRRFAISRGSSLVCASLFSLLPYHFLRGESHLLLSAYYAVPLGAYLVLSILDGRQLLGPIRRDSLYGLRSKRTVATVGICVVVSCASGSFYYSGFTAILIVGVSALRAIATRRLSTVVPGAVIVGVILFLSVVQLSPEISYRHSHGRDALVGFRQPFESEYYSLRLTQLVLPMPGHRLSPLAHLRATYDGWTQSTQIPATEAVVASLGTFGTLGLLVVVLSALTSWVSDGRPPFPKAGLAGVPTILAFAVATMGGVSSIIALFYSDLRAWNRLSIFIAYFSFFGLAVLLDALRRAIGPRGRQRIYGAAMLAAIFVLGLADQTNASFAPQYGQVAAEWANDADFVARIERMVPKNSSIFELPYASFPESVPPPPGRTTVYDLARPYLHSQALRWSFGAERARPEDWAASLSAKPMSAVVPAVSAVGFAGIYVDRFGYQDDGRSVENQLTKILGTRPIESDDKRLLFFELHEYSARLRTKRSRAYLESLARATLSGE